MHILVVEDERKVASFIKRGLEAAHYSVDVEHDGATGLNRLIEGDYDLIDPGRHAAKARWARSHERNPPEAGQRPGPFADREGIGRR